MKRALVLSGGGAKGSYQVGVYKALKKLGIKINIICGTSIGSINGALFCEGKYNLAKKMWCDVSTYDLFGFDVKDKSIDNYKSIFKFLFKNKGLSFDNASNYLNKLINERMVRNSRINYGLVTYSYKNKKPLLLTKESIPSGKLIDYIIASASCFPAIEKKKIGNDVLIDGGYYDNLPINLAIQMGADEVIAVDLNAVGFRKEYDNKKIKVDVIKCLDKTLFTLDFDKDTAIKNISLGYNDTMKYYKALDGNIYTFKLGNIIKNYKSIETSYISLLKDILLIEDEKIKKDILSITRYRDIFDNINMKKSISSIVLESLEYLGDILDIDKSIIYNINTYNKLLVSNIRNLNYININKKLKGKMLIGYMYNKYINCKDKEKMYKELFNMALFFQKEFLATIYLLVISDKYLN